jgi:hypothetical protein
MGVLLHAVHNNNGIYIKLSWLPMILHGHVTKLLKILFNSYNYTKPLKKQPTVIVILLHCSYLLNFHIETALLITVYYNLLYFMNGESVLIFRVNTEYRACSFALISWLNVLVLKDK